MSLPSCPCRQCVLSRKGVELLAKKEIWSNFLDVADFINAEKALKECEFKHLKRIIEDDSSLGDPVFEFNHRYGSLPYNPDGLLPQDWDRFLLTGELKPSRKMWKSAERREEEMGSTRGDELSSSSSRNFGIIMGCGRSGTTALLEFLTKAFFSENVIGFNEARRVYLDFFDNFDVWSVKSGAGPARTKKRDLRGRLSRKSIALETHEKIEEGGTLLSPFHSFKEFVEFSEELLRLYGRDENAFKTEIIGFFRKHQHLIESIKNIQGLFFDIADSILDDSSRVGEVSKLDSRGRVPKASQEVKYSQEKIDCLFEVFSEVRKKKPLLNRLVIDKFPEHAFRVPVFLALDFFSKFSPHRLEGTSEGRRGFLKLLSLVRHPVSVSRSISKFKREEWWGLLHQQKWKSLLEIYRQMQQLRGLRDADTGHSDTLDFSKLENFYVPPEFFRFCESVSIFPKADEVNLEVNEEDRLQGGSTQGQTEYDSTPVSDFQDNSEYTVMFARGLLEWGLTVHITEVFRHRVCGTRRGQESEDSGQAACTADRSSDNLSRRGQTDDLLLNIFYENLCSKDKKVQNASIQNVLKFFEVHSSGEDVADNSLEMSEFCNFFDARNSASWRVGLTREELPVWECLERSTIFKMSKYFGYAVQKP